MDDLPNKCIECDKPLLMIYNKDPKRDRVEPLSNYWNEEKQISFCGPQHSLDNYERDRHDNGKFPSS